MRREAARHWNFFAAMVVVSTLSSGRQSSSQSQASSPSIVNNDGTIMLRGWLCSPSRALTRDSKSVSLRTVCASICALLSGPMVEDVPVAPPASKGAHYDEDSQLDMGAMLFRTRVLPRVPKASVIKTLCLSGNGLDDGAIRALCRGLRWSTVVNLDLSHNAITSSGCAGISRYLLSDGCNVATLSLAWNDVRTNGVLALANAGAISECVSLRALDLSANAIGGDVDSGHGAIALKALTKAVAVSMLSTLRVTHNYFSDALKLRFKRQLSSRLLRCIVDDAEDDMSGWRCLAGTSYEPHLFFRSTAEAGDLEIARFEFRATLKSRCALSSKDFNGLFDYDWSLLETKKSFRQLIKRHFRDSSIQYISKRAAHYERAPARFESSSVRSMQALLRRNYGTLVRLFQALCASEKGDDGRAVSGAAAVDMAAAMGVAAESKILRRVVAEICSGEHLVECMEQEMRERIERLARNVLDLDLWTNSPICLRYNGMPPDALDASLPFAMHRHEFCIEFMLVLAQALHKGYLSYGRCSGRDSACRSSPSPRSSKVSLTHAVGELIKTDLPRFAGSIPRLVRASRIGSIDDDASTEAQVGAFYQYVQDVFLALAKDRPFITLIDWLRALRRARLVVDEDCTPVQPLPADFAVLSYAEAKCIYASALSADAEDDFHTQHKMGLASFRVALTKVASMICMPSPSTLGNLGMMMDASAQPGAVTADYLAAARTFLRFSWSLAPSLDDSRVSRRYSSIVEKSGIGLSLGERAFFVAWCLRREVLGQGKGVDCAWDGRFAADTAQTRCEQGSRGQRLFKHPRRFFRHQLHSRAPRGLSPRTSALAPFTYIDRNVRGGVAPALPHRSEG